LHISFMSKQHWLVKQEPEDYSWADFAKDGSTTWTGVRSFPGRKNLRAMQLGDLVFYYHSGAEKQIVGIAQVSRAAYPDPTATEGDWSCVDLKALRALRRPVTLSQIKDDSTLKQMALVKQTRLSVMPVTDQQVERIMTLAGS
jgi:predicted RNA-binding protein with PUA-like domain